MGTWKQAALGEEKVWHPKLEEWRWHERLARPKGAWSGVYQKKGKATVEQKVGKPDSLKLRSWNYIWTNRKPKRILMVQRQPVYVPVFLTWFLKGGNCIFKNFGFLAAPGTW